MADIIVTIKTAVDEAIGGLKKYVNGLSGVEKKTSETQKVTNVLKGSYTELNASLQVAKMAFAMVQEGIQVLIGDTQQYNQEILQLSRITGTGTEETSRMVQMLDDLGISFDMVEQASRGAAQKGIALTTDKLAEMSVEYKKLAPGVERNTYLLDNLGRSGLEFARVLEKDQTEIRGMASAIDDSMIVTKEAAKASEDFRKNLDDLNDMITGLRNNLANDLIPALSDTVDGIDTYLEAKRRMLADYKAHGIAVSKAIDYYYEQVRLEKDLAKWVNETADAYEGGLTPALQKSIAPGNAVQNYQWEQYAALAKLNPEMGTYVKNSQDLAEENLILTGIWNDASAAVASLAKNEEQRARIEDAIALASGKITKEEMARRDMVYQLTQAYIDGKMGRDEYIDALQRMGSGALTLLDAEQQLLSLNGSSSNVQFTINGQNPEDFYRNYGNGPGWGAGGSSGGGSTPTQPGGGSTPPAGGQQGRNNPNSVNVVINGWQGDGASLAREIDRQNTIRGLMSQ